MSTHKTKIEQAQVERFLKEHFHVPNPRLVRITDGETSQAFLFDNEEGGRVLRINAYSEHGFIKDRIAQQRFGDAVPIPRVVEIGEIEPGVFFAVSERVPGKTLDKLSKDEMDSLVPEVIRTLDVIHAQEPFGEGFGYWDETGKGQYKTWREELENHNDRDSDETRSVEFYDAGFHDRLAAEVRSYFQYCLEVRQPIHHDFGFDNVVANEGVITGVFDWEYSAYGDPLYDVARLDFWDEDRDYEAIFREHYEQKGRLPDNYHERVLCYKLRIGLGSMGFYAQSRQKDKYDYARKTVEQIKR